MLELFLQNVWKVSIVVVVALIAIYVWFCARKIFSLNREIKKVLETSDLAEALKDSELLAPAWKNFEKSLTKVGDEFFSTTDAAEFFSPQNLTRNMNMTFWQSYGGIFTGLGILGTFAGLTFGLSGVDMTSGDIEVLKGGIAKLLSGVESAFVTSLVGIFFAIVYSVIHHCLMKNFYGNVQKLADKLDENFPRLSAESLLEKSYDEAQSQTAELKNIDTTVSDQKAILQNIGEQVSEAIHNALDERLAEYVEKICAAIENLGKGGSAAIGEIFVGKVGEQMERFSDALDKFSDNIDEKLKAANEISKIMNEQLLNTLKTLNETLSRQAKDSAEARGAAEKQFTSTLENLIGILNVIAETAISNETGYEKSRG
ncbi:MAG: anti-phage defense ZorAB system ZorA [Selenomonadaceae bacterium]|nr:anti-phage defense ZorAB system ZorA [Selenomonadaceae bacterium]